MNKKIAIIGHGVVGKAIEEMIGSYYSTIIFDPKENKDYPTEEINSAFLAVICVPTNSNKDGSCDISIVEESVKKLKTPFILIKSTIVPGTTDYLIKKYKKKIVFSPEYIGESEYYHPFWQTMKETPFYIFGGNATDTEAMINFLEPITGPTKVYYQCSALEAEIIKYMENAFFATKVTFVNEFYNICNKFGANWHKVREGWLLDSRINKMFTSVFKDKKGFGGKCLPKDLRAIIKSCERKNYSPDLLKQVVASNRKNTIGNS